MPFCLVQTKIVVKKKDAIRDIQRIILDMLDIESDEAMVLAKEIYTDVVARAVEDERQDWIHLIYHNGGNTKLC